MPFLIYSTFIKLQKIAKVSVTTKPGKLLKNLGSHRLISLFVVISELFEKLSFKCLWGLLHDLNIPEPVCHARTGTSVLTLKCFSVLPSYMLGKPSISVDPQNQSISTIPMRQDPWNVLNGRFIQIGFGDNILEIEPIATRVPQGSVLGLLSYILTVNVPIKNPHLSSYFCRLHGHPCLSLGWR